MTRTRSIGTLACVLAVAGLVAGCGGGAYTAAESGPTGTTATTTTGTTATGGATGAADATSSVIGAVTPEDPSVPQPSFDGYQEFPESRAGKIFVDPTPVATTTTAATTTTPSNLPPTPVPGLPTTTTATTTTPTTTTTTTTQMVASLEISGTAQSVKVGDQVPSDSKQFTVQAISTSVVTLKVNSGTLPGGGTTVDITVGQSVTLSNPSTGASYTIKVVEIKQTTG